LTIRYFCVVQKKKGVTDAMIEALYLPENLPDVGITTAIYRKLKDKLVG
jgi:hypothetical protein